ncbi:MAG: phosphotransferase, partial [Yaniella sp.]|nr:phosphotransferase [Yaniella sp.]
MSSPDHGLVPHISRLAAAHNLAIGEASIRVNELGLDFRVAIADTLDGEAWVLRIPRRHDVIARAETEARLLQAVAPHLSAAVPDWLIHTDELLAYPLLPGKPGLTLDESGAPVCHFDVASLTYAESLGDLLPELHAIDPAEVRDTGVVFRPSGETRQSWQRDIETVAAEFEIARDLRDRWQRWLHDDSYWP